MTNRETPNNKAAEQKAFVKPVYFGTPLRRKLGNELYNYVSMYVNAEADDSKVVETASRFNIENLKPGIQNIVNFKEANYVHNIHKYLRIVNNMLPFGGIFVGVVETPDERINRIRNRFPRIFSFPVLVTDLLFTSIFQKFEFTRRAFSFLTKGEYKNISKAEILGRLVASGFDIVDEREIDNKQYFVASKVKDLNYNYNREYGFFINQKRFGKDKNTIEIKKIRTMYPYSEYLQEYMYRKNSLKKGGKFDQDFRITSFGKIIRRLWLDEIPALISLFKGDLKLVGVRPLSRQYFGLYSSELKEKRSEMKPGLIPPFYRDMPETFEEIMESELRYIDEYKKNPVKTDLKYFFSAFYNIVFKKVRSS